MADIIIPNVFAPLTQAKSAEVNANFSEVATKFNSFAVRTDVARTMSADLLFTDGLYDIGKSGATRPRDGFFSRNLTVSGTGGFGQAPEAANAVAARSTTSDATSNMFLGRNSGGVALFAVNGAGLILGSSLQIPGGVAGFDKTISITNANPTDWLDVTSKAISGAWEGGVRLRGQYNGGAVTDILTARMANLGGVGTAVNQLNGIVLLSNALTTGASVGELVLENSKAIRGNNAAGTGTVQIARIDANNALRLAEGNSITTFGSGITTLTGAAAGEILLANGLSVRGANAAGTNTFGLIALNASDQVILSPGGQDIKWGKPGVAVGGGAAATLGTIGGSGPTVAAQNSWLKIIGSGGTVCYFPIWV